MKDFLRTTCRQNIASQVRIFRERLIKPTNPPRKPVLLFSRHLHFFRECFLGPYRTDTCFCLVPRSSFFFLPLRESAEKATPCMHQLSNLSLPPGFINPATHCTNLSARPGHTHVLLTAPRSHSDTSRVRDLQVPVREKVRARHMGSGGSGGGGKE